jgi:surface antigen
MLTIVILSYRLRGLFAAFLVYGLIVLLAGPSALATNRSRGTLALSVGSSGQQLSVRITGQGGARCVLHVAAKHNALSLPAVFLSQAGRATLAWTVPTDAPSGKWVFSIICRGGHTTMRAKHSLVLINHGDGRGGLMEADSMRVLDGALGGGKGAGPCGAQAAPDQNGHCVSFPGDPFNYYEGGSDIGQCTWYAAGRRPDLWGITRGNAKTWLREAAGRVPEGNVPVPGAIAVDTGGAWGHVAYVVGVSGPYVIVDDSNYWNNLTIHYSHPIPASNFAGYIYGGPAGNGSVSTGRGDPGSSPVRSIPPDSSRGAVLNQSTGLISLFAQGANNSLDDYWVTAGQPWAGPVAVGGAGSTYSTPAAVINQGTGLISLFAQGANNSLDDYWVSAGQPWAGPVAVGGAEGTYSAPAAVLNQSTGLISLFAQGPEHTLDAYWVTPGQPWSGPVVVGGVGSTYSTPAAVINQGTGLISLFAQGPEHTLDDYWVTPGQPWTGPLAVGGAESTYSAPAAVLNQSTGLISLFAQGANNSLDDYWVTPGQPWAGPLAVGGAGSTYSTPAAVINQGTGLISLFAQGANNSLDDYWVTAGQPWAGPVAVGGAEGTYSAPNATVNGDSGLISLFAQGANNSLDDYWVTAGQPWAGPLAVGGTGTTFESAN